MAVNVTANWRLIRSLDPLLRRSDAGRAIFVTSGARAPHPSLLGRLCREQGRARHDGQRLRRRSARIPSVRVNLYNPGPMRTGMRKQAFPGEKPESLPTPERAHRGLIRLALPSCTLNGEWVAGDAAS